MQLTQLPKPKSQLARVLRALIKRTRGVSERDMNQNGFRSRISNLRDLGLNIRHLVKHYRNDFGHPANYRVHFLRDSDREKALKLYEKINSK
jgi:hypothetical protein